MRRARAAGLCCVVLMATSCSASGEDAEAAFRRYVSAWPEGSSVLARTITGADSDRLIDSLRGLRTSGAVRATVVRASPSDDSATVRGVVGLDFADRARLELSVRATVQRDRVVAEPTAVSTRLTDWERLRVEEFGAPTRGDILSRDESIIAKGPARHRVVARPALEPAVSLIDDALDVPLAGHRGRRLVAGTSPVVLAKTPTADGEDVVTSLDDGIQRAAENALGKISGALVAVDPDTGGIRALVSNPQRRTPGRSPATSAYSPGSTFKVVTAVAALEGDVLDPTDIVQCPARLTMGEAQVTNFADIDYGPITFQRAFAVSCNTAFARIGVSVGTTRLLQTAQRLGFRVGELDGPGTIAVPRSLGELAVWSFGAAGSLMSPLQMAGLGATIARGGTFVSPGWIDHTDPGTRVLRADTTDALVSMMEDVVETGTGTRAAVRGVQVAGKTGTADPQIRGARPDAWFLGLIPARQTRLVAVGFLPGAGVGGDVAAPLVQRFFVATRKTWRR